MNALLGVSFVMVGLSGTAVVLVREPLDQVIVIGLHGLLLSVLFAELQAPDVALSQLVVGAAAVPTLVLLSLVRARKQQEEKQ